MPTLALCIPAYNAAKFLPTLLQSAGNQQTPFNEILVYNDCSTDNTADVAEKYGARVINGDINRGCSYGKNKLAEACKSDWLHFHDADDDILPQFSNLVYRWIAAYGNEYDVLILNFQYIDHQTGLKLGTGNHNATKLHEDVLKYAIENKIVNFGVYKKSSFLAAGGFDLDPNVLFNEDNALHQRLAKAHLKFDYLPEITCINYRYGESMSSSNLLACARANYHVLEKTAATHGQIYPAELSAKLWDCIASLASYQDWPYAKKALALNRQLGYPHAVNGNKFFNFLTRLSPFGAVWFREKMIRTFKPYLRGA